MYEFNRFIKNSKATMFNFPEASSQQMLHYLDVHLEVKLTQLLSMLAASQVLMGFCKT